jgi:hypothetical protein
MYLLMKVLIGSVALSQGFDRNYLAGQVIQALAMPVVGTANN